LVLDTVVDTVVDTVLDTGTRTVPAEWIDYNGHMNDAYYFVAFTEATEVFLDRVGLGRAHREQTGGGMYTVEAHLRFHAGVQADATLRFRTRLLGHDTKRLRISHEMTALPQAGTVPADGSPPADPSAATCELLLLYVHDEHVTPMPPDRLAALAQLTAGPN
jgi:acyl-CoA thioester hydrolase